ncbi:MAG: hypothetical protein Fur002_03720 [Anaerolineales bacterium]
MQDDVRKTIYSTLIIFVVGVSLWVSIVFLNACGFSLACNKGIAKAERTPVPTLPPAFMPAADLSLKPQTNPEACRVAAAELIGAWAAANAPESEAFSFTDADGRECEATYADVQPLFVEPNFWYKGSLSCVSCHSADMTLSLAQLDLSSYAGVVSGSRRADAESKGTDILSGGTSSLLYQALAMSSAETPGHTVALTEGYFISVGKPLPAATPAP